MGEVTTEKIDKQGRVTIDNDVRELLGIKDKEARLRLEVEVREVLD